ncbi:hypothetical protein F5I97DRAFT_1843341 [Phlebopus sp. FC_14]|nr:hypothetical protein F5I97DRAFT_1843341 [Phlebopus sp. FC_14]
MESFPMFFKIRAITFTCITILSFFWLVLLSIEMFTRWDISDTTSRSLMTLLVLTNTTTILVLPFLLLLEFRVWLDAARVLLLLVAQIGSATAFTYWYPQIRCPNQTTDDTGVCNLIDVYTLMSCWIIPAILILYSTYFSIMVYRQSCIPVVVEPRSGRRPSVLPLMDPEMAERRPSSSTDTSELITTFTPPVHVPPVHKGPSLHQPPSTLPISRRLSAYPSLSCHPKLSVAAGQGSQLSGISLLSTPQRHMSVPATKYAGGTGPRRAITITNPTPFTPLSSHPQILKTGVADSPASRPTVRHMSLMPVRTPSYEDGCSPVEDPKRQSAGRLSKPAPVYFM